MARKDKSKSSIGNMKNITNNLDEVYSCPFILNIPLSTESSTVYDGSLTLNSSVDYNFIKL